MPYSPRMAQEDMNLRFLRNCSERDELDYFPIGILEYSLIDLTSCHLNIQKPRYTVVGSNALV